MPFVVVYDANVLYPSTLRDLLIRVAIAGLVQAKWTEQILDETFGNLAVNRPDLDPHRLARTRELMGKAVRDCLVTGYEPLIEAITLPDPGDRHVLAAAVKAHAEVVVTFNGKDFPADCLAPWGVETKHPDDFLLDQFHLDAVAVHLAVQAIASTRRQPPEDIADVLDHLESNGAVRTAAVLRR
ncbi:PIN domain-containing protein [Sciscionella marina]|uniref:PIN domain-containing protein n=1 Tax=Sciscionella marina TaxID=508770 RepID=UPI00037D2CD1|nr:PIN domain-containing protein [Sciscionella marina]